MNICIFPDKLSVQGCFFVFETILELSCLPKLFCLALVIPWPPQLLNNK